MAQFRVVVTKFHKQYQIKVYAWRNAWFKAGPPITLTKSELRAYIEFLRAGAAHGPTRVEIVMGDTIPARKPNLSPRQPRTAAKITKSDAPLVEHWDPVLGLVHRPDDDPDWFK